MSEFSLKLTSTPIVEAIIDIDCDMPPAFELAPLEVPLRDIFHAQYPSKFSQFRQQFKIEKRSDHAPEIHSPQPALQAFHFRKENGEQLVQVRENGFSFNRLAPYTTLDDYLKDIQWAWEQYVGLVKPMQIQAIRLRYINRIILPMIYGQVKLEDYFKIYPQLPGDDDLIFTSFFNQHTAIEESTGYQANIILASQPIVEDKIPVIFDISAASETTIGPDDWERILQLIQQLRVLKNRIFEETLGEKCIALYQE